MRVRKKPGAYEALLEYDTYYIDQPEVHKGKWHEVFGNSHPIHAEFGGGKGKFIIEMAKRNPEVNFIMVDAVTEVVLKAVERAEQEEMIPNLKIIKIDLRFAQNYFDSEDLDRIYLNFSDPWPKKRHYKRRLTYRDFMDVYKTILKKDGWIHFKTDNRSLFEFSLNEFATMDLVMRNIALDLHAQDGIDNVMTEYEEKFSSMGHPIFRVEVAFR
ncbi:tRNA (guanosine(46)-N7)-methyltransferase TrmB [Fusibacter bizertensis]|uniref:tRNA (guanine-N(7)-)-methyltransferase n=1 Tax=Fusibacter bizertensis TaxID=1488331 RepID=A0ABT6NGQ9_9FIRM|nr:tRNA (guanosine(46)-N7)-methyltransferase TrmB [Fusibacter bizertensis]MDH8679627.1 tRNA (guanosine(46)-N7)-methyltransferase TrmB [Fusibacter bizertensis]